MSNFNEQTQLFTNANENLRSIYKTTITAYESAISEIEKMMKNDSDYFLSFNISESDASYFDQLITMFNDYIVKLEGKIQILENGITTIHDRSKNLELAKIARENFDDIITLYLQIVDKMYECTQMFQSENNFIENPTIYDKVACLIQHGLFENSQVSPKSHNEDDPYVNYDPSVVNMESDFLDYIQHGFIERKYPEISKKSIVTQPDDFLSCFYSEDLFWHPNSRESDNHVPPEEYKHGHYCCIDCHSYIYLYFADIIRLYSKFQYYYVTYDKTTIFKSS